MGQAGAYAGTKHALEFDLILSTQIHESISRRRRKLPRLDLKINSMILFFGNVPRFAKERCVSYPTSKHRPNKTHLDNRQHKHKSEGNSFDRRSGPSRFGSPICRQVQLAVVNQTLARYFHLQSTVIEKNPADSEYRWKPTPRSYGNAFSFFG